MSAAKHTPGPLELRGEPGAFWIVGPDGSIVLAAGASAKCGRSGDYYECGHIAAKARLHLSAEDARLFTAAPCLLKAALLLLEVAERVAVMEDAYFEDADIDMARAAIAQALGEAL